MRTGSFCPARQPSSDRVNPHQTSDAAVWDQSEAARRTTNGMVRPCLRRRPQAKLAGGRPAFDEFRPNVGIWSRSSYSIMPLRQRGKQMIVDLESWEAGYDDGLRGRPSQCTPSLDRFSYSSGYFQARAHRKGTQEAPRYARSSTQLAAQRHGGNSRLIII